MPEVFHIAGIGYDIDSLRSTANEYLNNDKTADYLIDTWGFIKQWINKEEHVTVQTSGSTGEPALKRVPKLWMRASANATAKALGLNAGQSALLCISARHIGGMMMIVRSFELGMELIIEAPSRKPNPHQEVDFTAMVPVQVKSLLESEDDLGPFGTIILGGAPLDQWSEKALLKAKTPIYATFGMTETVSHIALRRLDGMHASDLYKVLDGVSISTDVIGRLRVSISHMNDLEVLSNDLVAIEEEGHFKWLGRIDNVINSGGLKIHPEQLEVILSKYLNYNYFIYKEIHEVYGESVVLCIESQEVDLSQVQEAIEEINDSKQRPKSVYLFDNFSRTENGKVQREKTFAQEKRRLY